MFARAVGADAGEAEQDLAEYTSFGAFFARRLRNGSRVVDAAPDAIVSPCDGHVAAAGPIVGPILWGLAGNPLLTDGLPRAPGVRAGALALLLITLVRAARVLDPFLSGANTGAHAYGRFFKDYKPSSW